MELYNIESLTEKYFRGETSIAEEKQLKDYFSSEDVAQHLAQYKPMFCYFLQAKLLKSAKQIPLQTKKHSVAWLSIAASVVVMLGVGAFVYYSSQSADLGTYDDPEIAFRETQKALSLLSGNVNKGLKSVKYVDEFDSAKDMIFTEYY